MKVSYSPKAFAALQDSYTYIDERNPSAAMRVVVAIEGLCLRLGEFPGLGRISDIEGIRVIPLVRYPYLIFYTVLADAGEVRILRIRHSARKPLEAEDFED